MNSAIEKSTAAEAGPAPASGRAFYSFVGNRVALAALMPMLLAILTLIAIYLYTDLLKLSDWRLYALSAAGLLLASLVSMITANAVARYVTGSLNRLSQDMAALSIEPDGEPVRAPRGAPREIDSLYRDFAAMAQRLRRSYVDMHKALGEAQTMRQQVEVLLQERDKVIRDRTAELRERSEQLGRVNSVLEKVAGEDVLTGLANRRAFDDFLGMAWRLGLRENAPVALLLLDLDHFKAYNDTYGHVAGDDCLRHVGRALREQARRQLDFAARYGGEEFAMVLGRTDAAKAMDIAESVGAAIRALNIAHEKNGDLGIVTASIGVVSLQPDSSSTTAGLIQQADAALYAAKAGGRNRAAFPPSD